VISLLYQQEEKKVLAILDNIKEFSNFNDFFFRFKKKAVLKIYNYLNLQNIFFLKSKNKNDAISELIDLLHKSKVLKEKDTFQKKIIEREKIVSTGIGMGVAIPHAKLEGDEDFFIGLGITHRINWNSIDNVPVKLIFMIGGPEIKKNEYLLLLSKLTVVIRNETLRKKILKAESKEQIIKLFRQF
jgi:nitrogen PTS system EIIA component